MNHYLVIFHVIHGQHVRYSTAKIGVMEHIGWINTSFESTPEEVQDKVEEIRKKNQSEVDSKYTVLPISVNYLGPVAQLD